MTTDAAQTAIPALARTPARPAPHSGCSHSCWSTRPKRLVGRRDVIGAAVALPAPVREPVCGFLTVLDTVPLGRLQRDYVETFDVTRRYCLYLTYFARRTPVSAAGPGAVQAGVPQGRCRVRRSRYARTTCAWSSGSARRMTPTPHGRHAQRPPRWSRMLRIALADKNPNGTTCSSPQRPRCPRFQGRGRGEDDRPDRAGTTLGRGRARPAALCHGSQAQPPPQRVDRGSATPSR